MANLFHFANNLPVNTNGSSNQTEPFGVIDVNNFRLTSSFTMPATAKAYAVLEGTVLLQQQSDVNKVNLILKPKSIENIKFPVKYIIYRGLNITSFLSGGTDILNSNTKVIKTAGSELISKMQEIQQQRSAGTEIPLQALFGYNLAPENSLEIDKFFFTKQSTNSQLFTVPGGIELGTFAGGNGGIEIILENPEYFPTVEMAKKDKNVITVSDTEANKKWQRDLIRHFIDPAAFYGMHYDIDGGIGYRDNSGNKSTANTAVSVFDNILKPFSTRSTIYLDIRNENGYSYNYYNNYVGISTSPNYDKELLIGEIVDKNTSPKKYYTNNWAVHIVEGLANTATGFAVALRISDNIRPLISAYNVEVSPYSVLPDKDAPLANRVTFVDETKLLPTPIPSVLPEFTKAITIKIPNTGSQLLASIVKLDYIKQLIPVSESTKFPKTSFTDYLFGHLDSVIPWDSANKIQWFSTGKTAYIDALNEGYVTGSYKTTILAIDNSLNEIEIYDEVPIDFNTSIRIYNDSNTQNVGTYTPVNIKYISGRTKIKVSETIPSSLQAGDKLFLTAKIDGKMDYVNSKFVILNSNCTNLEVLANGNKLKIYSKYSFSEILTISSVLYKKSNTEISFSKDMIKTGFAGIAETGMIVETDTAIGGANDNDRVLFYAAPIRYFKDNGIQKQNTLNSKGGALGSFDSVLKALESMMPGVLIDKVHLKTDEITDVSTFKYLQKSKAKQLLFLLGLSKAELVNIKNITSTSTLSNKHLKLFKLQQAGSRENDINGIEYYKYELQVAGLDDFGNYVEVNTGISIYTLDHLFFTSKEFAEKYGINLSIAEQNLDLFLNNNDLSSLEYVTYEDKNMLDKSSTLCTKNNDLLEKDTKIKNLILNLRTSLNQINPTDKTTILALLKEKGAELYTLSKQRIKIEEEKYYNKDGILYIARLKMQVIIKNHPIILKNFSSGSDIKDFYDAFEKTSRGLDGTSKVDFSIYPSNYKKILISGFDPFNLGDGNLGTDRDGDLSNSSGNISLSLDGFELCSDNDTETIKGIIRSAIFPVRWEDFDNNIVENFFKPYIELPVGDPNRPNMIITFSYGVHYNNSIQHDFHFERFAANWRNNLVDNNDKYCFFSKGVFKQEDRNNYKIGKTIKILPKTPPTTGEDKRDWTFIESTLPFHKLEDLQNSGIIKVGNYNIVINHGPIPNQYSNSDIYYNFLYWDVYGTPIEGGGDTLITEKLSNYEVPNKLFPSPFNQPSKGLIDRNSYTIPVFKGNIDKNKPFLYGGYMACDSNELKYFHPQSSSNPFFVPFLSWENYKDISLESNYKNIRIEARNGSGGNYMSNEIFYRVAYCRKEAKSSIPTGHIHIGFQQSDPHFLTAAERKQMLEDIIEIIKKMNDIL